MSTTFLYYVTYIRTTPEQLWQALTEPALTRRYWFGCWQENRIGRSARPGGS